MADTNQFNPQSSAASRSGDTVEDRSVQQDFVRIGTDLIDALGNRAEAIVNDQKSRAASEIASLAAMLRNATQCIDQGNRGAISDYADDAAREIDRFANRLRGSSWRVLAADVEEFARRWPALFMASSTAAGFLLGRLLTTPGDAVANAAAESPDIPAGTPVIRPASTAMGGTLSDGGPDAGFVRPAGEEIQ
jgi:hypothetical protein